MQPHIKRFLLKSVLGQNVDPAKPSSVIHYCISKAYDDMMTVGRFHPAIGKKIDNLETVEKIIEKENYIFSSDLIEEVSKIFLKHIPANKKGYTVTPWGLAQKIVNMSFKLLHAKSSKSIL